MDQEHEVLPAPDSMTLDGAAVFDAFVLGRAPELRNQVEQRYDMLAAPNQPFAAPLEPGDVLVWRALGEGGLGGAVTIGSGAASDAAQPAVASPSRVLGVRSRSVSIEAWATGEPFSQAGGPGGRLAPDRLILRPKRAHFGEAVPCVPTPEPDPSGRGIHPLILRGSKRASVGYAQQCLNNWIARCQAKTESCTDASIRTQQFIATTFAKLSANGQLPLQIDCVFGANTERATTAFQRCKALNPDGKIGPITWPVLDLYATPGVIPTVPPIGTSLDDWLNAPLGGWSSAVATSAVQLHTTGAAAFAAFADAAGRCTGDNTLIAICGWDFYASTPLRPGHTIGDALRDAAGRGTRVRALFAHFPVINVGLTSLRPLPGDNTGAVAFVNGLPHGAAIHDSWVLHHVIPGRIGSLLGPVQLGMHHQKIWVVYDGTRLVTWIGGIDFNPNRSPLAGAGFLHDVQAELEGPAAQHAYEILRVRWNNHPGVPPGVVLPTLSGSAPASAGQRTRVVTTFGDPRQFAGLGPVPGGAGTLPAYPFAPLGSRSYRDLVYHAIDRSERFIYVEDQYLVDEDVALHLAGAMSHVQALIIVICDSNAVNGELHQAWTRRARFLAHLAPHSAKVAVVFGKRFIHAKVWVFDDVIAIVGSANINRRGFRHDSEAGVAFGDVAASGRVAALRRDLWSLQLGPAAPAPTDPPEASLPVWKAPPPAANVLAYNPAGGADAEPVKRELAMLGYTVDEFWEIVDPDCP